MFGMVLKNIETNEYRYFAPYGNAYVLPKTYYVSNHASLLKLNKIVNGMDLDKLIDKPNTKWKVELITNGRFHVFRSSYHLGEVGEELPDFIKSNRCIISMVSNPYKAKKL